MEPESLEGMDYQINSLSGASLESNGSDLTKILTPVIVVNQPNLIEKGINFFTKFEFRILIFQNACLYKLFFQIGFLKKKKTIFF